MIDQPPAVTLPIPADLPVLTAAELAAILQRTHVKTLTLDHEYLLAWGITIGEWHRITLCAEWAVKHAQRPE